MATTLGTKLGTMLGTELADMVDPATLPRLDQAKLYALTSFSTANYYATQAGGGEVGDAAGFGGFDLVRMPAVTPGVFATVRQSYLSTSNAGWTRFLGSNSATSFGTGSNYRQTSVALTASDAGRIHTLMARITPTPGVAEFSTDGVWSAAPPTVAAYVPASGVPMRVGSDGAAAQSPTVEHLGSLDFRGNPTRAQLDAVTALFRTLGDVPTKAAAEAAMPGTTVTHRWSLRDVLLAANVPVADGAAAPATIPDSVTAATVDAMTKTGSPVVRVIDPSVNGRVSYGALGFSATSYLEATTAGGLVGDAGGFVRVFDFRIDSQSVGAAFRLPVSFGTSWDIRTTAVNNNLVFYAGTTSTPLYATPASDIGRKQLAVAVWNGSTSTLYLNRVAGAASSAGSFTPAPTQKLIVGKRSDGFAADGLSVFGVGGWDQAGGITLAEAQAIFDEYDRAGKIVMPSGKTNAHVYDLTQDIAPAPQNGIPAQVLDRVGTDHLTRVGTDLQVAQRRERLWSYETTPIIRGATSFATGSYYDSATTGHDGGTSGKSVAVLARIDSQAANKTRNLLAIGSPGVEGAVQIRFAGFNSSATGVFYNGTGYAVTPAAIFTAADVGKLVLLVTTWDQVAGRVRMYARRAEVSTGTAATALAPFSGSRLRIGHIGNAPGLNGTFFAEGLSVFGAATWDGTWTLAEIQALHDSVMATESMQGIPGKTDHLYRFPSGAAAVIPDLVGTSDLATVGTPATAEQFARAFTW